MAKTRVWRVDPSKPDPRVIAEAAGILKEGGLVAFPTETVYGLGADSFNRNAVRRIFEVKGRPPDNPLIIHISSIEQLAVISQSVPTGVERLAEVFWPGPLTVVVPKAEKVPEEVTAGLPKVAVRMPAHNVALALIEELGSPIAAPSANLSGRPSPTSVAHVIADLYGKVEGIIDAGETLYGVESTIIDLTTDPPTLLRPGALPVERIEEELRKKVEIPAFARGLGEAEKALAPGTRYRHYAPRATLILVEANEYSNLLRIAARAAELAAEHARQGARVCILCTEETLGFYEPLRERIGLKCLGSRKDPFTIARNLFKALRELDDEGYQIAIAEGLEEKGLGLTIMNRLRKASAFNIVKV